MGNMFPNFECKEIFSRYSPDSPMTNRKFKKCVYKWWLIDFAIMLLDINKLDN